MIEMIMAIDSNGYIGKGGKLPWHSTKDLKHFQKHTIRKPVLMGSGTWDSLPLKPLPDRQNIVLSRTKNSEMHLSSVEEALEFSKDKTLMVIGGAVIYEEFVKYASTIYVTHVGETVVGGDAFFKLEHLEDFEKVESEVVYDEGLKLEFAVYRRIK